MGQSIVDKSPKKQADPASRKRILVVDDEETIRASLSRLLSTNYADLLVGTAESAEEALALVGSAGADLLLTDFKLPEMNGLQLAQRIANELPATRTILMTAYGSEQVGQRAKECGCIAYLEKPLDVEQLFRSIDQALCLHESVQLKVGELDLVDVLRVYEMLGRAELVQINGADRPGSLAIAEGVIVHAELGALSGVDALVEILKLRNISLEKISSRLPGAQTVSVDWQLLDAARHAPSSDELSSLLAGDTERHLIEEADEEAEEETISDLVAQFKYKKLTPVLRGAKEPQRRFRASRSAAPARALEDAAGHAAGASPLETDATRVWEARQVRELVNEGIEHFKGHKLRKAKACWERALQIDPQCRQAAKNLRVLENVLTGRQKQGPPPQH